MNLVGYFGSSDIWIPDPVLEQQENANSNNDFSLVKDAE